MIQVQNTPLIKLACTNTFQKLVFKRFAPHTYGRNQTRVGEKPKHAVKIECALCLTSNFKATKAGIVSANKELASDMDAQK